jgi:hypothetical protein
LQRDQAGANPFRVDATINPTQARTGACVDRGATVHGFQPDDDFVGETVHQAAGCGFDTSPA